MISSRYIHVVANGKISFFLCLFIFHCMYTIYSALSLLSISGQRLLLYGGYCKLDACNECRGGHIFPVTVLFSSGVKEGGIGESYGSCIFNFLRHLHTVFHSGCTSLQSCTVHKGFLYIFTNISYLLTSSE